MLTELCNMRMQQVMTYAEAEAAKENPFDLTKTWSHSKFPLREIGRMVLNRNPTNYFAEVGLLIPSHTRMLACSLQNVQHLQCGHLTIHAYE